MFYCTNCGEAQDDGKTFCRFCGEKQPGLQLINRLRSEARRLREGGEESTTETTKIQQETMSTLARLGKIRQEADEAARRRSGR
ncbi:MAG TPA: hypothetical protein EYN46_06680 [Candidatus Poseidoniales archaeon]|nr:MAG: hypothetical protein CXX80_02040 [Euryarchaeota archaeon]HIA39899.1 hypothetical protein [Candidatus Poseidoniales archaeon]HIA89666.1 hypothetical protein [Candidatus Poseidoniales archaeon]HIB59436.1 hypothetical protein [Candidatus Poseidoniales archaeon]HIO95028.1 hypothetical protein [Candidatus Poseidoniales archaeon]